MPVTVFGICAELCALIAKFAHEAVGGKAAIPNDDFIGAVRLDQLYVEILVVWVIGLVATASSEQQAAWVVRLINLTIRAELKACGRNAVEPSAAAQQRLQCTLAPRISTVGEFEA